MNAASILAELAAHGITARREGDAVILRAATGTVPADMIALARPHKPALLAMLPDTEAIRSRLLTLASRAGVPLALVQRLPHADLAACADLQDDTLAAYLRTLADDACMDSDRVPDGWTQVVHCEGCGPVWWSGVSPTVRTCPWCFRRRAGKAIPRP